LVVVHQIDEHVPLARSQFNENVVDMQLDRAVNRPKPSPCLGLVSARIAAASCVVELGLGEVAVPSVQQLAAKMRGPSYLAPASQARGILRSVSERTLLCRTARLALDSPHTIKSLRSILSNG
jgi:hypothetical protein